MYAQAQLGFPCFSLGVKCSLEQHSGEVLGPLRGRVLWVVLGSLGKGNQETSEFFFLLLLCFLATSEQFCCFHCVMLHYLKLKGKGKLRTGTSGSTKLK